MVAESPQSFLRMVMGGGKAMTRKNEISMMIIALAVIALILCPSCAEDPTTATLKLQLSTTDTAGRSIVPSGVPLDVTKYIVSGQGPQGSTFNVESKNAALSIEGLLIGSWNLTAIGRNSNGIDLIQGSTTFQLTPSPATATITLNQLMGKGTMRIHFSWDANRIQSPRLELELATQGGQRTTISPTSCDLAAGTAVYSAEHEAGSYTIQARLYSDDTVVAGCAEAIRIIGNKVTEGAITLDLDKYPDSPGTLRLINKLGTPIDCTITGLSSELPAMASTTASLEIPGTSAGESFAVKWYLDGVEKGTGTSFVFVPKAGEHRLDVVVQGAMLASAGSACYPFRATVTGTAGVPILVAEINDGTGGLNLAGTTRLAFLSDGRILLGNSGQNTLQVARLVRDSLQLLQSYSHGATHHTRGISDILPVPDTDLVVTAESVEPGVTLYQYDPTTNSLTKKYHRDGTIAVDKAFTKTSSLFYDQVQGTVFVTDPQGCYAAGQKPTATSESEWKYGWMTWKSTATIPFTKATMAATSPGNQNLAVISSTENSMKIMGRSQSGVFGMACYLDYKTSGVTGLSGVRAVGFSDDSNVVAGSANLLTRFSFISGGQWEQTQTVKAGNPATVRAMQNVEQIVLHPTGKYLYVIASGSKNVNCFTMSSDGTLNHIGELDCGTFVPNHGAVTPNGEYLVLASGTSNKILLYRLPK